MNIRPEEIETIENAGKLFNEDVKLIKTKGGFWVAVGKKSKNSKMESLAMGSHKALVSFQVEKQYKSFEPILQKSEQDGIIINLDKLLKNKEMSLFAFKTSNLTSVSLFKSGFELSVCSFYNTADGLKFNSVKGSSPESIQPLLNSIIRELMDK